MNPPAYDGEDDGDAIAAFDPRELDDLFDALADRERRAVLRTLRREGGAMPFDQLVDTVARDTAGQADHNRRRRVATSLHHVQLPKLESAGLVSESDPDGDVRLSGRVEDVPATFFESV